MSDSTQQGGPGRRRGLPAPHSAHLPGTDDAREQLVEDESLRRLTRPQRAAPGKTITVTGVVRRVEVESQPWVLDAEDGTTYELMFASESHPPRVGLQVTVTGTLMEGIATTAQVGPVLRIQRITGTE